MITTISKWGNSAAVRIPRNVLVQADLEEGSDIEFVSAKAGEITLRAVRKRQSIQDIFAGYEGGFLQSEEEDWGEAQGKEVW